MLAVVVTALLAGDVVLGTALPAAGIEVGVRKHSDYFRARHPVLHHGFKPNVSFTGALWGPRVYRVDTNSLGFKDRCVRDVPLESDRTRYLFIGDSFTEGIGVEFVHTFAGICAAELAKHGIEVLNAGVYSYAPILYLRKIEYLLDTVGLDFDEVFVFIDYSDVNDEYRYYSFDEHRNVVDSRDRPIQDGVKRFISEHTILLNSARTLLRVIKRKLRPPDTRFERALHQTAWSTDEAVWEAWGREGLARAARHMDELAALLAKRGIPLTIGIYPWPDQIMDHDTDNRQRTHWRAWAAAHGADLIDCFPAFLDRSDPVAVIRADFMPGDFHWNERGHAVMARAVLAHILRRLDVK